MNPTVVPVDVSLMEEVLPLLRTFNNPHITDAMWGTLFANKWMRGQRYCGYGLRVDQRFVGFLGMIFGQFNSQGENKPTCNLTSWIVEENYRSHSLSLLYPILKMKDMTLTNLSLDRRLYPIFKRFGFKNLESTVRILFLPFNKKEKRNEMALVHDPGEIRKFLKGDDLEIFEDHEPYPCGHLLIRDAAGYSYLVYSRGWYRKRIAFTRLLHVSNEAIFLRALEAVKDDLYRRERTPFLVIDGRLISDPSRLAGRNWTLRVPRMVRPAQGLTGDLSSISNLYSEYALFNN